MTRSSRDNLQMQRQWTQDADPSQPVSVGQYGRGEEYWERVAVWCIGR